MTRARATLACAGAMLLAAAGAGAASHATPTGRATGRPLATELAHFAREHPGFPGTALAVRAPRITWSGAAGSAARGATA